MRDGGENHANTSRATLQDSRWGEREKLQQRVGEEKVNDGKKG